MGGMTKRKLAFLYIAVATFVTLFFVTIPIGGGRCNPVVMLTFFVNAALWLTMLCKELLSHPFSLQIIHWFFFLFFFFFAALMQYMYRSFPWIGKLSDESVLYGNLVAFIWSLFFILGGKFKLGKHLRINPIRRFSQHQFSLDCDTAMVVVMTICVLIASYKIISVGLLNLLARATSGMSWSDNSSIGMLIDHATRAFCTLSAIFSVHVVRKSRRCKLQAVVIIMCLLVTSFPTGIARYAMASIYGALFLTLFPQLKKNNFFSVAFMIGFVIILPFLNSFRRTAFEDVNILLNLLKAVKNIPVAWLAADYDAFTTMCMALEYVWEHGVTFFRQLLGVVLFFIPRVFWPSKPVGSGHTVAITSGMMFSNISMPLPGEGYINFGIIGVILFAFVTGYLTKSLDRAFWLAGTADESRNIDLVYPVIMLMFFFICRGDLLSSWAYAVANIVVWVLFCQMVEVLSHLKFYRRQ